MDRVAAHAQDMRAGQHDQGQRGETLDNGARPCHARAVRQIEIAQHDVKGLSGRARQRVGQALDPGHDELARRVLGERLLHQARVARIVLKQQYTDRCCAHRLTSRAESRP